MPIHRDVAKVGASQGVTCNDPGVAWVGPTKDRAKAQGIKDKKGLLPWTASGSAIANGRDAGVTMLLFNDSPGARGHGKTLSGAMVGIQGRHDGEVALARHAAHCPGGAWRSSVCQPLGPRPSSQKCEERELCFDKTETDMLL